MEQQHFVYILTNRPYGTLYVGVTNDLPRRILEHRHDLVQGFTREHGLHRLVWYEAHEDKYEAVWREKLIKKRHRDWKVNLIQETNPEWDDLYDGVAA